MNILLRELSRLHNVPLPSEVDTLLLPPHADFFKVSNAQHNEQQAAVEDSDAEEIEDATLESEPESEVDEDLSLEMDDGRNANKVSTHIHIYVCNRIIILVELTTWILILKQKDEMDMEHLATLERLRQSQRQDYLKVYPIDTFENRLYLYRQIYQIQ